MKDFTLLQKATFYGLYDYADLLVMHGCGSKNLVDGLTLKRQIATPCPPIIFACYFGNVKLVKLLIDNKVGEINLKIKVNFLKQRTIFVIKDSKKVSCPKNVFNSY